MIKKILSLIKRHFVLFILCFLAFIVFVILMGAFLIMTVNTSGRYGNRLDGISKVKISKEVLEDYSTELEKKDEVVKAKYRIQGKIVYMDITFTEKTSLKDAKKIAEDAISKFDEDEIEFYDFSLVINQDSDKDDAWNCIGSKNNKDSGVSWVRS